MPLVYRSMKQADDGMPVVGENSKELGVRVPPNPHADVDVDNNGNVELNGKGMSVAEHWTDLLPHLIPQRLSPICKDARGSNSLGCYRMGAGDFGNGTLRDDLEVCVKPGMHSTGNVIPARTMLLATFQDALAATREEWEIDETPK